MPKKIREARLARLDPKRTFFGDELFGYSRFVLRELEGRIAVEVIGYEEFLISPPMGRFWVGNISLKGIKKR